jgi:hypothetical protein
VVSAADDNLKKCFWVQEGLELTLSFRKQFTCNFLYNCLSEYIYVFFCVLLFVAAEEPEFAEENEVWLEAIKKHEKTKWHFLFGMINVSKAD